MDGDKTAQSNCLRISSQKIEELWGLKDERVVVVVVGREDDGSQTAGGYKRTGLTKQGPCCNFLQIKRNPGPWY